MEFIADIYDLSGKGIKNGVVCKAGVPFKNTAEIESEDYIIQIGNYRGTVVITKEGVFEFNPTLIRPKVTLICEHHEKRVKILLHIKTVTKRS